MRRVRVVLRAVRVVPVAARLMRPDHAEILEELERGRIYECSLRDPQWHLDGLQDGETIFIDPRPSILETVLHELTHRRHPRWGERKVSREARRLLGTMDSTDVALMWRAYRRVVRKGRPVDMEP